jgi:hypothetical protein
MGETSIVVALPAALLTNPQHRPGYFRFSGIPQISLLLVFAPPGVLDGMEATGTEAGAG